MDDSPKDPKIAELPKASEGANFYLRHHNFLRF